jgi:hypothetical protein
MVIWRIIFEEQAKEEEQGCSPRVRPTLFLFILFMLLNHLFIAK